MINAGEGVEKREPSCTVGGNVNWYSHYDRGMENSIGVPLKAKNTASIWPSNTTPGIYPEKTRIRKDACTSVFMAALFTIARTWKQPKCPSTAGWIKRKWSTYTVEYYSAVKGNQPVPFAEMCIDLQIVTQTEIIQKEKDKSLISFTCRI